MNSLQQFIDGNSQTNYLPENNDSTLSTGVTKNSLESFLVGSYDGDVETSKAKQPIVTRFFGGKELPDSEIKKAENNSSAASSAFRWIGKQLTKPMGATAEEFQGIGNAIGTLLRPLINKDISMSAASKIAAQELIKHNKAAGDVLMGNKETSFSQKFKEVQDPKASSFEKKADAVFGIGSDLMLDPTWVLKPVKLIKGAAEAKGLTPAVTALTDILSKTKPAAWAKTIFSTSVADKEFMDVVNKFRNLKQYREGKSLEEAVNLQKDLLNLEKTQPEINKLVTNALENSKTYNAITDPAVKTIVDNLKTTYKTALEDAQKAGLKVGQIEEYAPHIKTKESFLNQLKDDLGLGSKEFSKGAIEKGRTIKGTVEEINAERAIKLFEDNPAIQLVKKGQMYAKAITSAEFANEVKKFAVDGVSNAVKVTNPLLDGMSFLPEHARIIDNYYTGIKPEEINVALKGFDAIQNFWKTQALVSPSYHIRNMAGNLWNNFLAGVNPFQYGKALQMQKYPEKFAAEIDKMKQLGVIDDGWYAKDIAEEMIARVKGVKNWKAGINPLSSQNYLFKGNRAAGSAIENNSRMAHYLDQISKGASPEQAAASVKKFLFDYSDLTPTEKNILKRVMPFYTWTRKNIPLQLGQLITQPAKFTVPYKIINDIESGVEKPNEKFMGDYLKSNIPVRIRKNKNGTTDYFMLGQWLPYASAIDFLSQPMDKILSKIPSSGVKVPKNNNWIEEAMSYLPTDQLIGMTTPFVKNPIEFTTNTSLYFKNTMGDRSKLEAYPGQQSEFWTPVTGKTLIENKWLNIIRNIRILNDINKWVDSNDPTKTKDSWQVKLLNTLVGKAGTYDVGKSKYFYDKDTEDYAAGLNSAIKNAVKKGYSGQSEVTNLRKKLIELKKTRRLPE